MNPDLTTEFRETLEFVREARAQLREEPIVGTARAGRRPSPWHYILRDREAHLIRLARLLPGEAAEDLEAELERLVRGESGGSQ